MLLGTKVEVLERSGSQDAAPGDLLFAKVVPIEGVALLEACAPVLLPPQDRIQVQVIELRRKIPADTALSGAELLREYDFELRELLLTLTDRCLYPAARPSRTPTAIAARPWKRCCANLNATWRATTRPRMRTSPPSFERRLK